jgi:hypothetical protein
MEKTCLLIFSLSIVSIASMAQIPVVDIPITVSDGAGGLRELRFGLDPTATDGIDTGLGEESLPPFPPSGVFEARFVGEDISLPQLDQGIYKDYRPGNANYNGTIVHELKYQVGSGTSINISWNLPNRISGRLEDLLGGIVVNQPMNGSGSYIVTNPSAITKLKMTIIYNLALQTVETPTFAPLPGTFTSAVNVTLSCATSGTTIRYTTNGSDPTESSQAYSSPIQVSTTTTIKARAYKSGWTPSNIATGTYTIAGTVATPTFNPLPGTYTSAVSVTLSCATTGATIRYTTNGADPTELSPAYISPIQVSSTTTIKARAYKSSWGPSNIATGIFSITSSTGTIQVITNLAQATFTITGPRTYTGSGTSWSTSGVPLGTYTIAYGAVTGYNPPPNETKTLTAGTITFIGTYTTKSTVATPTFSPLPGTYYPSVNVTISCATSGAAIRYTTNCSTPTEASKLYSTPILINSTTTIKARAFKQDWNPSEIATGTYTITTATGTIQVTTNLSLATFTITGQASYSGNGTSWSKTGAQTGTYTISYGSVSGYNTPLNETKTLTAGGTITFVGTYTPETTDFWQQTNGPNVEYVWALAINSSGHIFAGTIGNGCFRSTDNGEIWIPVNTGLAGTTVRTLIINANGYLFAGTSDDGIFRSIDNAASWTKINTGLTNISVEALAINSSGHIFAGTFDGGVFRSIDNGDNWTQVNTGLTNTPVVTLAINSSGYIFAGTRGGGIFRSTNNGGSWTSANNGLIGVEIVSFAINSSGWIFAGSFDGGGIFSSTDNGGSWTRVINGLTNLFVESLAINSSGHIFAGTNAAGVFRSMNNGDSWVAVNTGLIATRILSLAINSSGHIFAGTMGGGVFRSVQPTTAVKEIAGEIPTSFSLEQNYPNPFNPSTTIQFSIPLSCHVTLKVYNTFGQEVATLLAKNLIAGKYKVKWNAWDLASGVYFYHLDAGSFVETRKLTLLR